MTRPPTHRPAERLRRSGRRAALPAAFGTALVLAPPGTALAASGDLDATFGRDGRVTTPVTCYAVGHDIARQSDGRLVVVGVSEAGYALARYGTNGALDTTFSGDGTPPPPPSADLSVMQTGATCALGSPAPGASATVTLTAEPRATCTLAHTAGVSGTPSVSTRYRGRAEPLAPAGDPLISSGR